MSQYHQLQTERLYTCRDIIEKKFRAIQEISLVSSRNRTIVRKDKIIIIKGVQISKLKWWQKYLCCQKQKVIKVTVKITSNANNYRTSGLSDQNDDKILFYYPEESDPIFTFITKGSDTKVTPNSKYIL